MAIFQNVGAKVRRVVFNNACSIFNRNEHGELLAGKMNFLPANSRGLAAGCAFSMCNLFNEEEERDKTRNWKIRASGRKGLLSPLNKKATADHHTPCTSRLWDK